MNRERPMNIAKSRSVGRVELQLQTPNRLLHMSDRPMLVVPGER